MISRVSLTIMMIILIINLSQAAVITLAQFKLKINNTGYTEINNLDNEIPAMFAYIKITQNHAKQLQRFNTSKILAKKLQDNITNYRFIFTKKRRVIIKEIKVPFNDSWKEILAAGLVLNEQQRGINAFYINFKKKGVQGINLTIVNEMDSIGGFIKVYAEVDVSNISQPAIAAFNVSCIEEINGCNQKNAQQLYNGYYQLYKALYSKQNSKTPFKYKIIFKSFKKVKKIKKVDKVDNSYVVSGKLSPHEVGAPSYKFKIKFDDQKYNLQFK